jgi:hypothetical protein
MLQLMMNPLQLLKAFPPFAQTERQIQHTDESGVKHPKLLQKLNHETQAAIS